MNPEYENAYFQTVPPTNGWPPFFGVITACNPDGKIVSDDENAEATNQLRLELESAKLEHFPVTGGSKDFIHTEPGFGVVYPSQDDAMAWGRRYRQEAIFWIQKDKLSLVSCMNSAIVNSGLWSDRLDMKA